MILFFDLGSTEGGISGRGVGQPTRHANQLAIQEHFEQLETAARQDAARRLYEELLEKARREAAAPRDPPAEPPADA